MASASLQAAVQGKTVVVTGASDGIGAHLARRLGAAGARLALVARSEERLLEVAGDIRAQGGEAHVYVANIAYEADCDRVIGEILADHGRVDIFVSNAGRSIRRSVKYQGGDRFHDFQRLMSLNYFGALRLVLGVLPGMAEHGAGQIVHVSSFGVPSLQPRFAGYAASKSALDVALHCAAGEVESRGVHVSTVYMPLVQTKMVESKGHSYDHFSMLSVDMACEYIEHAIVTKRAEVFDAPTRFLSFLYAFRPSLLVKLNSLVYRLESERPPDGVAVPAAKPRRTQQVRSVHQDRILRLLGSLLWFFSSAEFVLVIRGGLPWIFRDVLAVIVVALVLVVYPICVAAVKLARAGLRGYRRALAGPKVAASAAARPAIRKEAAVGSLKSAAVEPQAEARAGGRADCRAAGAARCRPRSLGACQQSCPQPALTRSRSLPRSQQSGLQN